MRESLQVEVSLTCYYSSVIKIYRARRASPHTDPQPFVLLFWGAFLYQQVSYHFQHPITLLRLELPQVFLLPVVFGAVEEEVLPAELFDAHRHPPLREIHTRDKVAAVLGGEDAIRYQGLKNRRGVIV